MSRKVLQIKVDLHIHAVNCPGAWICPHGKVALHLYMLDSWIETEAVHPVFPLNYEEKVVFYKCFPKMRTLTDLYNKLDKVYIYAELVQYDGKEEGNILATFQNTLNEVLFPDGKGTMSAIDVDLLMEPSPEFPAIIAPKIELSSRTTVEEVFCTETQGSCPVLHHKMITSNPSIGCLKRRTRQRRVCHSAGYHRRKPSPHMKQARKPVFAYRKIDESLIARKPGWDQSIPDIPCSCKPESLKIFSNLCSCGPRAIKYSKADPPCTCHHFDGNCTVCTKYKFYFGLNPISCPDTDLTTCVCQEEPVSVCCRRPNKKVCFCDARAVSLAKILHERVSKNLDCRRTCYSS